MGGIWWDYNHPQLVSKWVLVKTLLVTILNRNGYSYFSLKRYSISMYFQVLDTTRFFPHGTFSKTVTSPLRFSTSPGGGRHGLRQQRGQRRAGGVRDAGCLEGQRQGHATWRKNRWVFTGKVVVFTRFFLVKSMGTHYGDLWGLFIFCSLYLMRLFWLFFFNQSLGIGIIWYYMILYAIIWDYIVKPTRLRFSMDWFQGKSWPETAVIFGMMWCLTNKIIFLTKGIMQFSWETIVFAPDIEEAKQETIAPRSHMLHMLHVWISRTKTPRFPTKTTHLCRQIFLTWSTMGWVVTRCRAFLGIPHSTSGGGDHSLFFLWICQDYVSTVPSCLSECFYVGITRSKSVFLVFVVFGILNLNQLPRNNFQAHGYHNYHMLGQLKQSKHQHGNCPQTSADSLKIPWIFRRSRD